MAVDLLADLVAVELPALADVRLLPVRPITEPARCLVVQLAERERDGSTGYAVSEWTYALTATDRTDLSPTDLLDTVIDWALAAPDEGSWGAVTAVSGPIPVHDPARPGVITTATATISLRG